jgi:KDO2-lipid IV(A) lauroyltransferase
VDEAVSIVAMNAVRRAGRKASELAEAGGLIAVMSFFACLPVDWASGLGGRLARTIGPRLGMSRRALKNIRAALPERDDAEHRRILRGMFDNLGRTVAEFPHMEWICAAASGRVEIVDARGLAELTASGKPGLLFSGHFANWEAGSTVIHRLMGGSLLSVYRAANNPSVNWVLRRILHARQAVPKGGDGGRDLVRHLRRGGHVGMLVDQKLNDGITVPFFGRAAMTAPAIARLARHFHAPILPVRIERLAGARFRFTVLPQLAVPATSDGTADVLETMTRINRVIEAWVRERPEQWLWLHRRWPD